MATPLGSTVVRPHQNNQHQYADSQEGHWRIMVSQRHIPNDLYALRKPKMAQRTIKIRRTIKMKLYIYRVKTKQCCIQARINKYRRKRKKTRRTRQTQMWRTTNKINLGYVRTKEATALLKFDDRATVFCYNLFHSKFGCDIKELWVHIHVYSRNVVQTRAMWKSKRMRKTRKRSFVLVT